MGMSVVVIGSSGICLHKSVPHRTHELLIPQKYVSACSNSDKEDATEHCQGRQKSSTGTKRAHSKLYAQGKASAWLFALPKIGQASTAGNSKLEPQQQGATMLRGSFPINARAPAARIVPTIPGSLRRRYPMMICCTLRAGGIVLAAALSIQQHLQVMLAHLPTPRSMCCFLHMRMCKVCSIGAERVEGGSTA